MMHHFGHHFGRLPIMALVMGGMMAWRLSRMRGRRGGEAVRGRGLRLDRIWIVPAVMALGVGLLLWQFPPRGVGWVWTGLGLVLGAAVGWWRGGTMRISVDPRTGALNQQASPIGLYVVAGLFVLRFGLRAVMIGNGMQHDAGRVVDALAVFTLAMIAVQRLEMTLRARRLLSVAATRR